MIAFALLVPLASPAPQHHFDASLRLRPLAPGGEVLQGVRAVGDVDQDGDVDLAATTGGSFWFRMLVNDGAGRLALGPQSTGGGGNGFLGDVNGDGDLDHVTVAFPHVWLSLGAPGAGFQAATPTQVLGIQSVDGGDFDGDGRTDAAALVGEDGLVWLVSTGTGFQPQPEAALPFKAAPYGATVTAVLDLGGDGLDDAALGAKGAVGRVFVVRTLGGGATAVETLEVDLFGTPTVLTEPCDLDGDGDQDLAYLAPGEMRPLYQEAGGALVPGAGVAMVADAGFDFRFVDWDADGDLDLAGTGGPIPGHATLLERTEQGFLTVRRVPVETDAWPGLEPDLVDTADLDLDGLPDLVLRHHVVFGNGSFAEVGADLQGAELDVALDLDGDHDLDLLDLDLSAPGTAGAAAFWNDGAGGGAHASLLPSASAGYVWSALVLGDFDGDGLDDVVAERHAPLLPGQNVIELYELQGTVPYAPTKVVAPAGADMHARTAAWDVDLDGDLDAIAGDVLWRNDGSPFLVPEPGPFLPGIVLAVADADADGSGDFLVRSPSGGGTFLSLVLDAGGAAPETLELLADFDPSDGQAAFRDVDGDGDLDVLGTSPAPTPRIFAFENAGGAFSTVPALLETPDEPLTSLAVGDVNADGIPDLVAFAHATAWPSSEHALVLESDGPWSYPHAAEWYLGSTVRGGADLDRDGDLDCFGQRLHPGSAASTVDGGQATQFGVGNPGAGGFAPLLNVDAPLVPAGNLTLRLVHGLPDAIGVIVGSTSTVELANFPLPGLTGYVVSQFQPLVFVVGGTSGVAGTGAHAIPIPLGGASPPPLYFQAYQLDPAAVSGLSASNAVEAITAAP